MLIGNISSAAFTEDGDFGLPGMRGWLRSNQEIDTNLTVPAPPRKGHRRWLRRASLRRRTPTISRDQATDGPMDE
jgi:hypothetical protein